MTAQGETISFDEYHRGNNDSSRYGRTSSMRLYERYPSSFPTARGIFRNPVSLDPRNSIREKEVWTTEPSCVNLEEGFSQPVHNVLMHYSSCFYTRIGLGFAKVC